jgi:glutathione S-transferase
MRLYISAGSPFARKCRVVRLEKGLQGQIEEVLAVFPYKDADFMAINPIGQVPALVRGDGVAFIDSPVICAYLDALGEGEKLLPAEGEDHWRVRRMEVLGDAIMETTVKQVMENRRPDGERSPQWTGYWREGMDKALDQAEREAPDASGPLDLGKVSLACAGLYLGFRFPDLDWRSTRPRFAAFCHAMDARPSFAETRPSL